MPKDEELGGFESELGAEFSMSGVSGNGMSLPDESNDGVAKDFLNNI